MVVSGHLQLPLPFAVRLFYWPDSLMLQPGLLVRLARPARPAPSCLYQGFDSRVVHSFSSGDLIIEQLEDKED